MEWAEDLQMTIHGSSMDAARSVNESFIIHDPLVGLPRKPRITEDPSDNPKTLDLRSYRVAESCVHRPSIANKKIFLFFRSFYFSLFFFDLILCLLINKEINKCFSKA
jgi:hypothetical protein